MKIFQQYNTPRVIRRTVLILSILIGIYVLVALQKSYFNHEQRGISIGEANSHAIYDICLPSYLPDGVLPDPNITYDEEFGDPIDSKVWIDYFLDTKANPVIRIYYIHNPTAVKFDSSRSLADRGPAHYWLSFWANKLHVTNVENSLINIEDSYVEEPDLFWRFVVVEPKPLHTVLIEWTKEQVFYQLFSIFSLEETQRIANSIAYTCE
jgi:hypothetical protein